MAYGSKGKKDDTHNAPKKVNGISTPPDKNP
jgi:hypothetical protein